MLYRDLIVNHRVVFSFHVLLKFVDYIQRLPDVRTVRFVSLSSSLSIDINLPDLLVALHASVRKSHASPSFIVIFGQLRYLELGILNIEGKLGIEFVFADSRPWTLCFTHSDIQNAELVPDHTVDLSDDRIVPVMTTVFVESHTSCKIDSRCDECRDCAGNYASAHWDLSRWLALSDSCDFKRLGQDPLQGSIQDL